MDGPDPPLAPTHEALGYGAAPTATAMLHAGVLKKFGLYGLLRIALPLMPQAAHLAASVQSNALIISDRVANARRVVDMIERLDRAAPAGQKCPADGSYQKGDGK